MGLEWEKLVQGVKNNQPEIVAEWTGISRNEQKHALRELFGRDAADHLRRLGWSAITLGPLTKAMISRFMIKLSKALYFRHNNSPLDGVVYVFHINAVSKDTTPELLNSIMAMAPSLPMIKRNNTSLFDQFIYRFNYSPEPGVIYAVVRFGEQYIFQLIALSSKMADGLAAMAQANGTKLPTVNRFDCFLQQQR